MKNIDTASLHSALECCINGKCDDCPRNTGWKITKMKCQKHLMQECYGVISKLRRDENGLV